MADRLLDDVGALLREAAATVVVPMFRRLDDADITEKAPGELVTVADRRAEEFISARLRQLRPGSVVVGEEAVAEDPDLLRHLRGAGDVWLVDPVDGTANFAAGRRPFALMVALLTDGAPVASWVYDPLDGTLAACRTGAGTRLDGATVRNDRPAPQVGALRGTAMTRFLPPDARRAVEAGGARIGELLPGQHCAGREYLDILTGAQQFVLFWRTLPWDHAPGTLLVREAGGVARRFDGTDYRPADDGRGLLVAASPEIWDEVRSALLAG
ncbi:MULTISPECIES: inositol monophosphatase family protein [Micromonospora]|uniref:Inositol monophosphatase n=1 Tax=Micromonospora solifontis TaxID=2487138 RepID=A0ABX9WKW3_9ACTN|nr:MULTISPECIES: inositol monophosphatase family protein [Micromonospora]NES12518.1 inositol monophosphatase [Micromonospora sp. PPF5-17B]NES36037.1 inositol monophosphatase [Micromonospora solifontis]NES54597.1 inositol monophosphatase [Micromonospora sp. PPF5-6]RNL99960.1 inositol monophosphatase [Micromonospora solifontis]